MSIIKICNDVFCLPKLSMVVCFLEQGLAVQDQAGLHLAILLPQPPNCRT
jgi:hypothetical protein